MHFNTNNKKYESKYNTMMTYNNCPVKNCPSNHSYCSAVYRTTDRGQILWCRYRISIERLFIVRWLKFKYGRPPTLCSFIPKSLVFCHLNIYKQRSHNYFITCVCYAYVFVSSYCCECANVIISSGILIQGIIPGSSFHILHLARYWV